MSLRRKRELLEGMSASLAEEMKNMLAVAIENFGNTKNIPLAEDLAQTIRMKRHVDLTTPLIISRYLTATIDALSKLLASNVDDGKMESMVEDVIIEYNALLNRIIDIRTDSEKKEKSRGWNRHSVVKKLEGLRDAFKGISQQAVFDETRASSLFEKLVAVDSDLTALLERLREELPNDARLHMSTIGSSHQLPIKNASGKAVREIEEVFGDLHLDDVMRHTPSRNNTIVIFDESGCIPSFELLGLSRLGRNIEAILLVGDKQQLPPYDPYQRSTFKNRNTRGRRGRNSRFSSEVVKHESLKSLLEISKLSLDHAKIMLTTQYRVPRDIADILNVRVYKGLYNTPTNADVPSFGLTVVDIKEDPNPRKAYVNSNENQYGLQLLDQLMLARNISDVLIITPVSGSHEFIIIHFFGIYLS